MKTKKLLLTALCLAFAVSLVLALAACGPCEHAWTYENTGMREGHSTRCTKCHRTGESEPHTCGVCGTCEKCGFYAPHEYVAVPDGASEERHKIVCGRCGSESDEVHALSEGYHSFTYSSYHVLDLRCWSCNFTVQKIGDHKCTDLQRQASATSHWFKCDDCDEKFGYEIHDLENGACTVCGYAADSLPVTENLVFTLSSDESYYILTEIPRGDDDELDIIIPDTYEGKPVKAIGMPDVMNYIGMNGGIKALYIPDGVIEIGDGAFEHSLDLVYVRLPDTLEKIGRMAFQNCQLVNITIPGSVRSIDFGAFEDNKTLRNVVVGEGVTNLGSGTFSGCSQIISISLPSTMATVSDSAFADCDGIKSITLGEKDGETGKYPNSNGWYKVVDNCLIERAGMKLIRASADMKIPSEVKALGEYALSGDGKFYGVLEEPVEKLDIVLPSKLEQIENGALSYGFVRLISFAGYNKTFAIEGNCLYAKASGTLLFGNENSMIPENVTSIANGAFKECTFGTFTLPSRIESMGEYAFSYCHFDDLMIEDGVKALGFSNCETEQEVLTIPGSVKTVAYCDITGMKKVEISEGAEDLWAVFSVEVSLPSTLKYVTDGYKYNEDLSVYQGGKYWGDAKNPYLVLVGPDEESFDGSLNVHPDTKIIASRSFFDHGIISVTFGDKLAYIGASAFEHSDLDAEIVLPDSVKEIGDRAFNNISTVNFTLILGEGIEKIGNDFINVHTGGYGDHVTSYGNCQYVGTKNNPYLVLVSFRYYDFSNPENNAWRIHADTKFIMDSPESTDSQENLFDGTCEQWAKVYKCEDFINQVNQQWETPKFICADGVVDLYGATYGLEFKRSSIDPDKYAAARGTAVGDIVIPAYYKGVPVIEIALYGFSNPSITSVKLPETIVKIGEHAFATSSITEIVIPDSVLIIDEQAFLSCPSLTEVRLGERVERVEAFAFAYCPVLTRVILTESLEYFSSYAVVDCPNLALNEYDNAYYLGTENVPYYALLKVTDKTVTSCDIHAETRMILDFAFAESHIVSVVIPDKVYTVERYAFNKCKDLREVTFGKSVTKIEEYTFQLCTALTTVTFVGEVEEFGDWAFSYCRALVNFAFPDSLRVIGSNVFAECNKIVFDLGANIEKINGNAFYSCFIDRMDGIDHITFGGTLQEWNAIEKLNDWHVGSNAKKVICSDGEISLVEADE